MEASTLQKKKHSISKGKLKKNIKNVLCRPDQVFWPEITADQGKRIGIALEKYRIKIPEFKKLHWKELQLIPKADRPKPPILKKVEGVIFGISECTNAIQAGHCSAILIEATVNPRMIVHPIIELCTTKDIPILCMKDLRKQTAAYFGVKTCCFGLKRNSLSDLRDEIIDISKLYPKPRPNLRIDIKKVENMEVQEIKSDANTMDVSESPYLYRTSMKGRVFIPGAQDKPKKTAKKFIGQDFIEFSDKVEEKRDSKSYMKMILKRISNNPDRVKKK